MMYESGLILEGGGMRGVYTAGVLDFFIDKDIEFKSLYGVSAGACHGCSYLSKQRKRAFETNVNYLKDRNYCSLYSLITTGDLFGAEMIYNTIPNKLHPFDYEAFDKSPSSFKVVVTNIKSGKAEYIQIKDLHKDIIAVRASSSLPLLARNVVIGGQEYLDGGVSDSIPLNKSIEDGNLKNVLILTQHDGYRKSPNSMLPIIKRKYKKYPKLVGAVEIRHINYNSTLDFVKEEVSKGQAFVIQPRKPVSIRRIEKDKKRLTELYEEGYSDAAESYKNLMSFLSN